MLSDVLSTAADPFFASLRDAEFSRLDRRGQAYLDYTGAALYSESQVRAHVAALERDVLGNPHAEHDPSRSSTKCLEAARLRLLSFLDADPSVYTVCFTANATAAIKLVGESYPFGAQRGFVLAADNHNSVNGVREYARRAGARVDVMPLDATLRLDQPASVLRQAREHGTGLVAFPAQSNFSGMRHPLSLVAEARALGFDVLLDAAAFLPTSALSLRQCPADFVVLSFYKLFGYPTGVGALVARRDALARLHRPWFAGGTVLFVSIGADLHRLKPAHEGFEDGTPSFLDIAALAPGFDLLEQVGMSRLNGHVARLTARALDGLACLRHEDGTPLVEIYGPTDLTGRGGTIAFNVRDAAGHVVSWARVEEVARQAGVSMRGGCFCNPGAAEAAFGLEPRAIAECTGALGDAFTIDAFGQCIGRAVGAVRLSVGLATNDEDVRRAVAAVESCRTERAG